MVARSLRGVGNGDTWVGSNFQLTNNTNTMCAKLDLIKTFFQTYGSRELARSEVL